LGQEQITVTAIATPQATGQFASTVFVGRQPIFDRNKNVYAYELLYRSGDKTNAFNGQVDGDVATRRVMHGSLNVVGLTELTGSKRAFVNVTKNVLLNEDYLVLPRQSCVVELLETVLPDDEVLAACKRLKDSGYMLALDDFAFGKEYAPLLPMADIIKVDFLATTPDQRERLTDDYAGGKTLLLAEKVENAETLAQAMKLGYAYFQGYFFCKPTIISQSDIPALKQNCLKFIQDVNAPSISYDALEETIKHDTALSTKLLKYLNSASMGMANRIASIKQALSLLGEKPLRKWASLIALSELGRDKPTELMVTALVRARFCELLTPMVGLTGRELDLFLLGMLSTIDALTDRPLAETLAQIPLPADVTAALLGGGSPDNPMARIYGLTLAIERGRLQRADSAAAKLQVPFDDLAFTYRQATAWADQSLVV
jgi:c-di-GMP-related signal transduction protein